MSSGGAIANNSGALTINNSTVSQSTAVGQATEGNGGGISNVNGTVSINGSTITGNTANRGHGGAIRHESLNPLNINNSIISNNAASGYAGGVYNTNGSVTITNSVFENNQTALPADSEPMAER